MGLRPSPFFSLFKVVRTTQIFAFSKNRKTYAEGNDIISNNCYFNLKLKKFFALHTFSFYFILQPQRTLTFQRERLSVRVIGKHLRRVTLFVPAACHRALFAACHWSLPGSGAFLPHRMHDLVDGSCPVVH